MPQEATTIEAAGHEVRLSSPSRVVFPETGHTKLDLANYYVEVGGAKLRHVRGVFVDCNQNARDRTVASAYSARPVPDARVSCPLTWDEVPDVDPAEFTLATVPKRLADVGDPSEAIDEKVGSLQPLLDLAARDEEEGLGDAPWPPHFRKQRGEGRRVQPSRAKKG